MHRLLYCSISLAPLLAQEAVLLLLERVGDAQRIATMQARRCGTVAPAGHRCWVLGWCRCLPACLHSVRGVRERRNATFGCPVVLAFCLQPPPPTLAPHR